MTSVEKGSSDGKSEAKGDQKASSGEESRHFCVFVLPVTVCRVSGSDSKVVLSTGEGMSEKEIADFKSRFLGGLHEKFCLALDDVSVAFEVGVGTHLWVHRRKLARRSSTT